MGRCRCGMLLLTIKEYLVSDLDPATQRLWTQRLRGMASASRRPPPGPCNSRPPPAAFDSRPPGRHARSNPGAKPCWPPQRVPPSATEMSPCQAAADETIADDAAVCHGPSATETCIIRRCAWIAGRRSDRGVAMRRTAGANRHDRHHRRRHPRPTRTSPSSGSSRTSLPHCSRASRCPIDAF
jgi:hypothetical protein